MVRGLACDTAYVADRRCRVENGFFFFWQRVITAVSGVDACPSKLERKNEANHIDMLVFTIPCVAFAEANLSWAKPHDCIIFLVYLTAGQM